MLALAAAYEIQCKIHSPRSRNGEKGSTMPLNSRSPRPQARVDFSDSPLTNSRMRIAIATVDNTRSTCRARRTGITMEGLFTGITGMRAVYAASPAKRGFPTGSKRSFSKPLRSRNRCSPSRFLSIGRGPLAGIS